MDPADRFVALMTAESDPPLDECLLLLASSRPGARVDVADGLHRLDTLAASCPGDSVDDLLHHLFVTEGFRGDVRDYHDPRNSYLDEVLRRRVGMPITLSVVVLATGRRRGIALVGVGMPGHFLVRERDDPDGFIDPFHAGARIGAAACAARFRALHGPEAPFDLGYLAPVADRSIVQRILNNLTVSFRSRRPVELDWLLDVRLRLPTEPHEVPALAELCELRGRYDEAADLLERLPDDTHGRASTRATRLRARLN